jgi:TolB-like protein
MGGGGEGDARDTVPDEPRSAAVAALAPGIRVGRYVVGERIGAGGMGEVYAARDTGLGRKVALKVLRRAAAGGEAPTQTRLLREAQAMAQLAHPNVNAVYDVGSHHGQLYVAMELVDGCSLSTWLEAERRSWRDIVAVFCQAAAGLAAAHSVGFVHRDVKPSNILLGRDGRVRVSDFGLVVSSSDCDGAADPGVPDCVESGLTLASGVAGTPAYMSPEQLRGEPVTAAADQFSLCVALYESLYGQRPFAGDDREAHAVHLLAGHVRSPPSHAGVPAWMREVVERGLRPAPEDRFHSMEALQRALAGEKARARQRHAWAASLGILLAVSAVVAGRFWMAPGPESGRAPVLAVLPFQVTGSTDGGFLASGLHGDLLTRLGKLEAFRVISQTSVMEYGDTAKPIRQIGAELGATHVLEGRVQAKASRVRINAQLIDAAADEHVWAETFDRELTAQQLFEIQAELARAIAGGLERTLSSDDRAVMADIPTSNTEAYNAYLRGRELSNKYAMGMEDWRSVIAAYEEATRLDPSFALAWAHLSMANTSLYARMDWESRDSYGARNAALGALARARSLQPDLLEAELAWVHHLDRGAGEYEQAVAALEALEDRGVVTARTTELKARSLHRLGRYRDAYQTLLTARSLDPRDHIKAVDLVYYARAAGDCDAAGGHVDVALALAGDSESARAAAADYELNCTGDAETAARYFEGVELRYGRPLWLALQVAFIRGNHRRALELLDSKPRDSRRYPIFTLMNRAILFRRMDREAEVPALLDQVAEQLVEVEREGYHHTFWYAQARQAYHACLGDAEATRRWVAENQRRYRALNTDRSYEARLRNGWAASLTMAGLHEKAIDELRAMLEDGGGFSFRYVDAHPGFDALHDHPAYIGLRERFGDPP